MPMRVAIHSRRGSFSKRWVEQARVLGLGIEEVDGYSSGFMAVLRASDALLWHLNHVSAVDLQFARSILAGAEAMGLVVFPNRATGYHFDDKIAQKYLLEAVGAPLAPTWVFYSRHAAYEWIKTAGYPLVFKLRGGAGSANVRLIRTPDEARRWAARMFGRGLSPASGSLPGLQRLRRKVASEASGTRLLAKVSSYVVQRANRLLRPSRERGYVLFQQFMAGNDHDTRVTVIGNRAFIFLRQNRPGDFRASGGGLLRYCDPGQDDLECIEIAFEISRRLGFQSMAYDFVSDPETGKQCILEISYVFNDKAVFDCPGYFDSKMSWHEGHIWPQDAILEDVVAAVLRRGKSTFKG